jgi:hypothetical protein
LVIIPRKDAYGCSRIVALSSYQAEQAEIHSSHNFLISDDIPVHPEERKEFAKSCLRARGPKKTAEYLDLMLEDLAEEES